MICARPLTSSPSIRISLSTASLIRSPLDSELPCSRRSRAAAICASAGCRSSISRSRALVSPPFQRTINWRVVSVPLVIATGLVWGLRALSAMLRLGPAAPIREPDGLTQPPDPSNDAAVVGAEGPVAEEKVACPDAPLRLRLDGAALVANWRALDRLSGPAACGAAIKADGYGLGASEVARRLAAAGCRDFFVATWAEAAALAAARAVACRCCTACARRTWPPRATGRRGRCSTPRRRSRAGARRAAARAT